MQAVILAAGMGKRLKDLTENNTKCMVKVNGVTLIDRMLHQIDKHGLEKIVIVVGYKGDLLKEYIGTLDIKTKIQFISNDIYDQTNNIYSLYLAKYELIKDDTLLFESDLIFEDSVLDLLINDERKTLALVDKYESWMDGTCVTLTEDDEIHSFIPGKNFDFSEKQNYYKTVNIYKFSKEFSNTSYVPFLDAYTKAMGNNEYYEQVLKVITMLNYSELRAKRLNGQLWYEIDDVQDLDIATSMFTKDIKERVKLLQSRYGGYWRYPHLIDFCYLVNPYFPNKRLMEEIKASFETLLTQYPSGLSINNLLAAKNFGIKQENVVVGNGAAELIKILLENSNFDGNFGIIRPTFGEYSNRLKRERIVCYNAKEEKDFSYGVEDIIEFFDDKSIKNLVLINPDNPSGNYIKKKDVLRLLDWTKEKGINLILDESFLDFSDEIDGSLIETEIINNYKNLFIIKSISKSYGVPGLRLGILVSSNTVILSEIKKEVSIWNINSFAEFYLQIYEKYKKDYTLAMEKFRQERRRFVSKLKEIKRIEVIDSQANYVMLKLRGITSSELTEKLLVKGLFIKDLASKVSDKYVRIAIRNEEDNDKLINALIGEME